MLIRVISGGGHGSGDGRDGLLGAAAFAALRRPSPRPACLVGRVLGLAGLVLGLGDLDAGRVDRRTQAIAAFQISSGLRSPCSLMSSRADLQGVQLGLDLGQLPQVLDRDELGRARLLPCRLASRISLIRALTVGVNSAGVIVIARSTKLPCSSAAACSWRSRWSG